MTRGMRFRDTIPADQKAYASFSRMAPTTVGARSAAIIARWPCLIRTLTKEDALKEGFETATHCLSGPLYRHQVIQAGDRVTWLMPNDGVNWVKGGKGWYVIGRQHGRGMGDLTSQAVYVREEI